MDGEGIFSTILAIGVAAYLFGAWGENSRYQIAHVSNDGQAIVLDTMTGEAWLSSKRLYGDAITFRPIQYEFKQSESSCIAYTPEKMRNQDNVGWLTWAKKRLSESQQ